MKLQDSKSKTNKHSKDITITDFFALVDKVAEDAKTNPKSRKLIEAAVLEWQINGKYAI